jgi:RND family efflux transporter MFP subunit
LAIAVAIVAVGLTSRIFTQKAVARWTEEQAVPTVATVLPSVSRADAALVLPGTLQAFYSAPIYARVPGYLRAWNADIGAKVHKGEVLGTIETPDLDQQIEQAKANLANAVAARSISKITADRWSGLLKLDAVSQQEAEEKTSDLQAKTALVAAARADLDRLNALKGFARIAAPFDGVVTNRSVDVGALINAGAQTSSPLFTVADVHRIRVYVSVPQSYSAEIRPGVTATLSLPEYPGRSFTATLDTTSRSISEQSNALLAEFLADNPDDALKPGDYAQVSIHLAQPANVVSIPASSLIFNSEGLRVATVSPGERVVMKPVRIARDLGTVVDIDAGLSRKDRVVDNPPDSLSNGDLVRVQKQGAANRP